MRSSFNKYNITLLRGLTEAQVGTYMVTDGSDQRLWSQLHYWAASEVSKWHMYYIIEVVQVPL